jgi:hypothetical protein
MGRAGPHARWGHIYIYGLCGCSGAEAGPCRACARWPTRDRCHITWGVSSQLAAVTAAAHAAATHAGQQVTRSLVGLDRRGHRARWPPSSLAQITALGVNARGGGGAQGLPSRYLRISHDSAAAGHRTPASTSSFCTGSSACCEGAPTTAPTSWPPQKPPASRVAVPPLVANGQRIPG